MRVRRSDSTPRLEFPRDLQIPKGNAPTTSITGNLAHDLVDFPESNPITTVLSSAAGAGPGIPGLTHPKIQISDASAAALRQMAQEDPALYGRIVQHMNGLDRNKTWTVKLEPWAHSSISDTQHDSFNAQEKKSLSLNGLGAGGLHTSYFKGLVEYESIEKTQELSEAKPGNAEAVAALQADLQSWNSRLASSFAFAHDVGGEVSNPEVSAAALDELVAILEKHGAVLEGATIELGGFTSTSGSDAYNQSLSEERAATISGLLEERLSGTTLEGRVTLGSTGYGETRPLDASGQPVPLDADGRPLDATLEDPANSRRVEIKVTADALVIEGEPGQTKTWREGAGVVLEIKAKPETGSGNGHHGGGGSHVTKSRISQRIGGEIPCKNWMKALMGN